MIAPTSRSLREVLQHYRFPFEAAEVSFPPRGFSGAVIARISCGAGAFCLRGWPPDSLPKRRILGLHQLLAHVYRQGVHQVAVPVPAANDSTLVSAHGRFWQLEPWMPGQADFAENPTDERLLAAMRTLAAWHKAAACFVPPTDSRAWFDCRPDSQSPAIEERLQKIQNWLSGDLGVLEQRMHQADDGEFQSAGKRIVKLFRRTAPRVAVELRAARPVRYALQPCLRDVWHDHVLFTGQQVSGLIDASACRSENVATDLSRLLGSLLADDRPRWEKALAEYQRHRPLEPKERALVNVLDRSQVVLAGMTWLRRQYRQQQSLQHDRRIVLRLEAILARLQRLAEGM